MSKIFWTTIVDLVLSRWAARVADLDTFHLSRASNSPSLKFWRKTTLSFNLAKISFVSCMKGPHADYTRENGDLPGLLEGCAAPVIPMISC